jgi:hypothetical protein
LRARGRLMFTDCVVRDRAAIAVPWREFRILGNSLFLFSLLVGLGFLVVGLGLGAASIPLVSRPHHYPAIFPISIIVVWGGLIFVLAIAWALITHLMVPIMYRRRCRAPQAFWAAISLISSYPGEITLYCLFWIALWLGVVVVACMATCITCCVAALPYVGTVILLPAYVCLRAFGLFFLRQFGSDYDVWSGISDTQPGVIAGGESAPPTAEPLPVAPPPVPPSPPELNPPAPPVDPA